MGSEVRKSMFCSVINSDVDVMSRLRRKILVTRPCSLQATGGAQAEPPARQHGRVAELLPDHRVIVSFHNCVFQVVLLTTYGIQRSIL